MSNTRDPSRVNSPPTYWNAIMFRLDKIIKLMEPACPNQGHMPDRHPTSFHTCPHCLRLCSCGRESR